MTTKTRERARDEISDAALTEVVGGLPSWTTKPAKVILKPLGAVLFAVDARTGYNQAREAGESKPVAALVGTSHGVLGMLGLPADDPRSDEPPVRAPPRH